MLLRANSSSKTFPSGVRIGFLGGGQLARMMVLEAHRLGMEPHVFSNSPQDPAAQVTKHWLQGKLQDDKNHLNSRSLDQFIESMDYITFESEFIPTQGLLKFEKSHPEKIFPKPSLMKLLQNRKTQKQTLTRFKIPTSPFCEINNPEDLNLAVKELGAQLVLKSDFGGYDGYGTFFAKTKSDLPKLTQQILKSQECFIAEKWVPFKREVAVILIRTHSKKCFSLPLVQTQQTGGRCDWVQGPIQHRAYPALQKNLFKMLNELDYVGVMGVELFDTGPTLLVNELAPRVHNSGHYSQDALSQSQFALHIQAGLGLNLVAPQLLTNQFVMVNLLGESEEKMQIPTHLSGQLHLYGKLENRMGRKMGHVNYLGNTKAPLLKLALKERKEFQK